MKYYNIMLDKTKIRAQMKSKWYYFFWSSATVSVLLGQLYVGSGYRMYSKALMTIFESIAIEYDRSPTGPYEYISNDHH
tara:strand:+ start:1870 stop:2106 length:237 start_codon:yes stop_codon:yes gene_type:complete